MNKWVGEWASEHWLIDWLIDWFIDWLIDWLAGWLIGWLINWLNDWAVGWLDNWLVDWQIDWLIDWLDDWLIDWMIDRLAGWMNGWLLCHSVAWLLFPDASVSGYVGGLNEGWDPAQSNFSRNNLTPASISRHQVPWTLFTRALKNPAAFLKGSYQGPRSSPRMRSGFTHMRIATSNVSQ